MRFLKSLLPAILVLFAVERAAAATEWSSASERNERDWEAVTDFVKSKRALTLEEKSGNLSLSADVRMEWKNLNEKHDGTRLRGGSAFRSPCWLDGLRVPNNEYDIEMNLYLDYRGERCWGVAQLEFDNNAGSHPNSHGCCDEKREGCAQLQTANCTYESDINGCHGSGTCDRLALVKAYMGYNVFECGSSRFDIEVGRRNLFHVFDSKVQFRSRMDGILFRYSNSFEFVCDFYINVGAWVIDEHSKHHGFGGEIGLLDIYDTGIDLKYSFVDWSQSGTNRCNVRHPSGMQVQTSQLYAAFNFTPEILRNHAKVYGALLWNHKASPRASTANEKEAFAWYFGFQVGSVMQEGDWHFDINYQFVEAQSILDCDVSGIGRGNVRDKGFSISNTDGNVNYQGFRLEGLYALTDNLSINPVIAWSKEANDKVGGTHRFSMYELQLIYSF